MYSRKYATAAAFILPALILIFAIDLYPAIRTLILSLYTPEGVFDPVANWGAVLSDRKMLNFRSWEPPYGAIIHNLIWIVIHLPTTVILGLLLAVLFRRVKGKAVVQSIIFIGMVIPMVVGGLIMSFMFDRSIGVVGIAARLFGTPAQNPLRYPDTAIYALAFGSVWLWTGFSLILHSAALSTIPQDYYDQARVDGASAPRMFFQITIPLLASITRVVIVMTVIWELKIFGIVFAATGGGPGNATNVLALQMYDYAFRQFNFNYGAVVTTILLIMVLIVSIPMVRRSISE